MMKTLLAVTAALTLALSPAAFAKCKNCKDEHAKHAAGEKHDCCKDKDGKKAHKHGKGEKHAKKDCCKEGAECCKDKKDCCKDKECCNGKNEDKQAKVRPTAPEPAGRIPASAADFSGEVAQLIYDNLPGAPDKLSGGAFGKEGGMICYKKENSYLCSVRGEDEESGRFGGVPAKQVYERLSSEGEYEDKDGIAREAQVSCVLKANKYSCDLQ